MKKSLILLVIFVVAVVHLIIMKHKFSNEITNPKTTDSKVYQMKTPY